MAITGPMAIIFDHHRLHAEMKRLNLETRKPEKIRKTLSIRFFLPGFLVSKFAF